MLANDWMSNFDSTIKSDAVCFASKRNEILRDINKNEIQAKLKKSTIYLRH